MSDQAILPEIKGHLETSFERTNQPVASPRRLSTAPTRAPLPRSPERKMVVAAASASIRRLQPACGREPVDVDGHHLGKGVPPQLKPSRSVTFDFITQALRFGNAGSCEDGESDRRARDALEGVDFRADAFIGLIQENNKGPRLKGVVEGRCALERSRMEERAVPGVATREAWDEQQLAWVTVARSHTPSHNR